MKSNLNALVVGFGLVLLSMPGIGMAGDKDEEEIVKSDQGRFNIFIAEHNIDLKGKNYTLKSIFKMDKETGTVWRYRQGVDSKGKPYEEFFEIPNQ